MAVSGTQLVSRTSLVPLHDRHSQLVMPHETAHYSLDGVSSHGELSHRPGRYSKRAPHG